MTRPENLQELLDRLSPQCEAALAELRLAWTPELEELLARMQAQADAALAELTATAT